MDYLPQNPAILVSSINMLLRDEEFDSLESLCYNFNTEPEKIKAILHEAGYVYSDEQEQFRPIGFVKIDNIDIAAQLFALQDKAYADFQSKLLPTVQRETVIGVRTPDLRKMAKHVCKTPAAQEFMQALPHRYFDENQLHAFILSEEKDFNTCNAELERFLPYVDNWATCDQLSPKCFKKHTQELLPHIRKWMQSTHTYTIRFGMGMLMRYYLDEAFRPEFLEWVASIKSDEYYIRMMQAWFFATALAKQWDATLPYIEQHRLEKDTHNKTIQKAVESFRITDEQKALLKTLRIK